MDNLLFFGLHLSILTISLISISKLLINKIDNIHIIIVHLDKNNKYILKSTIKDVCLDKTIELDIGYKLNHYEWDAANNTLLLFLKEHNYDSTVIDNERNRKIILPNILSPLKIKEIYK